MVEPINLNRARKARARAADTARAAQNRVLHGRTKAERAGAAEARDRLERTLEGVRRTPADPPE